MLALLPASAAANTRIIVKRESGLTAAERADLRADAGVRYVESLPLPRTEVVTAAPGDVRAALRELNADPDVVYAEPDLIVHAAQTPEEPDPEIDDLWGLQIMEVPFAWDMGVTGAGRTVAVVDSGVDATHPELAGRVVPGYDWVDDDPFATDLYGHGTHVAGIIVAKRDGTPGVAGVAHGARILPLRVLDEEGSGFISDTIKAYDLAADRGVRIVNASLAGDQESLAEREAIERHPDVLFVVPAGNGEGGLDEINGDDNDTLPNYPCSYALPNILCVGASTQPDEPAAFSDFGANTVDVFAPGTGIETTERGGGIFSAAGTSIAAPQVAGIAALLLSATPALTPSDVIDAVVTTADQSAQFTGRSASDGRANARRALEESDIDGDTVPDIADTCPHDPTNACAAPPADRDGDGFVATADECPDEPAPYAADGCPGVGPDTDGDGWPDLFDNCDSVPNANQRDLDGDGIGDACDADVDNDGYANNGDNCAVDYNPTQSDRDLDGRGDVCDDNRDGDGVSNAGDACPDDYGTLANGCPAPPPPSPPANGDGDDRIDSLDLCPAEYAISNDGCPLPQIASVSGKVRKRGTARSVTVKVVTTRLAMLRVTIERKRSGRWRRVKRSTVATVSNRARVAATRIQTGRYRVRVSIYNGAGTGAPVSARFRVS